MKIKIMGIYIYIRYVYIYRYLYLYIYIPVYIYKFPQYNFLFLRPNHSQIINILQQVLEFFHSYNTGKYCGDWIFSSTNFILKI